MICIVDYNMGNVGSILNILKKIGANAHVSSRAHDILNASKLILPGVGAFDDGIRNLKRFDLLTCLNRSVIENKTPILGICLGMQLFSKKSEEGTESGLGWIDAQTIRFSFDEISPQPKIPHMGWNSIQIHQSTPLFSADAGDKRFYFVHSYHVQCNDLSDVLTTTEYGITFTSSVCRKNILGTQFHPEKSHRFGIDLFNSFLSWQP